MSCCLFHGISPQKEIVSIHCFPSRMRRNENTQTNSATAVQKNNDRVNVFIDHTIGCVQFYIAGTFSDGSALAIISTGGSPSTNRNGEIYLRKSDMFHSQLMSRFRCASLDMTLLAYVEFTRKDHLCLPFYASL